MNEEIKRVVARVPESLYRAAKVKAAKTGKPMSEVIREALGAWVSEDEPEPPPNSESGQA